MPGSQGQDSWGTPIELPDRDTLPFTPAQLWADCKGGRAIGRHSLSALTSLPKFTLAAAQVGVTEEKTMGHDPDTVNRPSVSSLMTRFHAQSTWGPSGQLLPRASASIRSPT